MAKINDLKKDYHLAIDNVKIQLDILTAMVQYKGYEDINVNANVSWDSVQISIEHKKFNWTNFLTVTVKGTDFDFSHGSGGFRDSTVDERLKATKDMFEVVTLLKADTAKLEAQRVVISKLRTIIDRIRDTYDTARKEVALSIAYADIEKDHTEVKTIEEVFNTIKNGGSIYLYSVNCNYSNEDSEFKTTVQKNEVENRAMSGARANYYFQEMKYSKKDLVSALETRTFYTAN